MKKITIILATLLCSLQILAAPMEGEARVFVVKKKMEWSEVADLFHYNTVAKYKGKDNYIEDLKKWNSHIKGDSLKAGQKIYLDNPSSPYLGRDYIKELPEKEGITKKLRLFGSAYADFDHSTQKDKTGTEIDYKLYSFLSLSLDGRYNFENSTLTLGGHYSSPNDSASKISGVTLEKASVKPNAEFSFYLQHEISLNESKLLSLFYGLNYDSYNAIEVVNNVTSLESNETTFATLGLAFNKKYNKLFTQTKVYGAYSVMASEGTFGSYEGFRGALDFSALNTMGLSFNLYVKYLALSNNKYDLTSFTAGAGVGYFFF